MENAADALKMAGFVLLFILALTIAMMTLTQARTAAQAILYAEDDRNFYSYVEEDDYIDLTSNRYKVTRNVTMNDIIPTLYRYYKENYRVEVVGIDSHPLYVNSKGQKTYALDLDEEMENNEPWQGSNRAIKENLDKIVENVLLYNYKDSTFVEELGIMQEEEETDPDAENSIDNVNDQTKRLIRYTLVN